MLAANVCTSDFLEAQATWLYRVHEGPTPEKLANAARVSEDGFGLTLGWRRQARACQGLREAVRASRSAPTRS